MSEFTPPGSKPRMTKSQIRKYIKDLEEKRRIAQEKLDAARASGAFEREEEEVKRLESLIDDL